MVAGEDTLSAGSIREGGREPRRGGRVAGHCRPPPREGGRDIKRRGRIRGEERPGEREERKEKRRGKAGNGVGQSEVEERERGRGSKKKRGVFLRVGELRGPHMKINFSVWSS